MRGERRSRRRRLRRFTTAGVAEVWAMAGAPGGQILLGGSLGTASTTGGSFLAAVTELNGNAPPPIAA